MGLKCQILIQRPREGVHRAGRPVIGSVKYTVDEPTEYKDIILSLVGKGECAWREKNHTRPKREHHPKHIMYRGTEVFIENHISILDKQPGFTSILPVGTYEHHFRFILPENIPPSFQDSNCTIEYKIALKFMNPNFFSFNKKFTAAINVYGCVEPVSPEGSTIFGLEKTLIRPFSKRNHIVALKADISNTLFTPGQNAGITFTVTNNTDVKLTSIRSELVCCTTYIANCGRRKVLANVVKDTTAETPTVPADAVANMTSAIPVLAHLYTIQNSKIIKKEYKVRVTLRLPVPYINASVEIPIVIGEKKNISNSEAAIFARQVSGPIVVAVDDLADGPPSYWEAMREEYDNKASGSKEND